MRGAEDKHAAIQAATLGALNGGHRDLALEVLKNEHLGDDLGSSISGFFGDKLLSDFLFMLKPSPAGSSLEDRINGRNKHVSKRELVERARSAWLLMKGLLVDDDLCLKISACFGGSGLLDALLARVECIDPALEGAQIGKQKDLALDLLRRDNIEDMDVGAKVSAYFANHERINHFLEKGAGIEAAVAGLIEGNHVGALLALVEEHSIDIRMPIAAAASYDKLSALEALLAVAGDTSAALTVAVNHAMREGHTKLAITLLQKDGIDVQAALAMALELGKPVIVDQSLKNNTIAIAWLDSVVMDMNPSFWDIVEYAAQRGHECIINALLNKVQNELPGDIDSDAARLESGMYVAVLSGALYGAHQKFMDSLLSRLDFVREPITMLLKCACLKYINSTEDRDRQKLTAYIDAVLARGVWHIDRIIEILDAPPEVMPTYDGALENAGALSTQLNATRGARDALREYLRRFNRKLLTGPSLALPCLMVSLCEGAKRIETFAHRSAVYFPLLEAAGRINIAPLPISLRLQIDFEGLRRFVSRPMMSVAMLVLLLCFAQRAEAIAQGSKGTALVHCPELPFELGILILSFLDDSKPAPLPESVTAGLGFSYKRLSFFEAVSGPSLDGTTATPTVTVTTATGGTAAMR